MSEKYHEEWKNIPDFPGYQVSNHGRVRSPRTILKSCPSKNKGAVTSYARVMLWNSGVSKCRYPHRLVAQAFLPNPKKLPQVNHKDGNGLNNRVDNLEWSSPHDNLMHSLYVSKTRTGRVKMLTFQGKTLSMNQWGKHLGVHPLTIASRIRYGWSVEKTLTLKPKIGRNQHV